MNTTRLLLASAAAVALLTVASAAGAQTYSNGPDIGAIGDFGFPDTQTYGEVFTAQASGQLTSFTMELSSPIGGTLYGGIGAWNCGDTFTFGCGETSNLYSSGTVAADHGGGYTFSPDVSVTAGNIYVAYLSVFGANNDGQGATVMPTGSRGGGFNYFVWNNSNGGPTSSSWNYFGDFGDGRLDYTVGGAVPEPATWAMMLVGFGGLGALMRRSRRAAALTA
ncbi:PEPxxWA-CTERM sorting domain-containing protein [Phenylobacterium sp.]|uniref:PEPxxWA-CTERM sorting domain-containing protein n=1 Tax=Phenylobacterium sp. TaxID=1871053 RepID=UPI002B7916B7|nr:PEPxxWA-CTERM sorting domain-containing protein [Phenylobacterium sp.]HLZ77595.1 PEPxxWA-CTERM sorting domain-containing protein [Phenylobacterium sp.]